MNELYKIWDRQVGSVEKLASNERGEPAEHKHDRHRLCCYGNTLRDRGALLIASHDRITALALSFCNDEQVKNSYNVQVKAFRSRRHNLLNCVVDDIERINSLCMTEELKFDGIVAVFSETLHHCDVREEINSRKERLTAELEEQYQKTVQTPFNTCRHTSYWHSMPDHGITASIGNDFVAASKAKREHLVQLAANFQCYEQLLTQKFKTINNHALCAANDAQIRVSFNSEVRAFISRKHSFLTCFQIEMQQGNDLCMTEELETDEVVSCFAEIGETCDIKQEIECRQKKLEQEFALLHDKLFKSSFYVMEVNAKTASGSKGSAAQTGKSAEEIPPKKST